MAFYFVLVSQSGKKNFDPPPPTICTPYYLFIFSIGPQNTKFPKKNPLSQVDCWICPLLYNFNFDIEASNINCSIGQVVVSQNVNPLI